MNDLIDYRERYPQAPGFKARGTSEEAAQSVLSPASRWRDFAFKTIEACGAAGATADEVAKTLDLSVLTIRPRVSELAVTGKIVDSGQRRRNASGRRAIVWKAP